MPIRVPIKVLHKAEGRIVTLETITGEVYRGKLIEAEDNMNLSRRKNCKLGKCICSRIENTIPHTAGYVEKCADVQETDWERWNGGKNRTWVSQLERYMFVKMNRLSKNDVSSSIKPSSTASDDESSLASAVKSSESTNRTTYAATNLDNIDVVLTSMAAGAIAGALAKTTIAPLDRAKINFQINKEIPYSFRGAVSFLVKTYKNEGFLALWRGNSATMARIVPYAAIQFTAHEQWRKILKVHGDTDTKGRRYVAGSLAGVTSQSLTYPLDLARARMAVTDKYTGYTSLRQVFVKIWIEEGPLTLYRGYCATVLGVIPYAGTSFFIYETLKKEYFEMTGNKTPHTFVSLAFGATAGLAGQTSSYPLDIVRRRMQTMGLKHNTTTPHSSILSTLIKIYREEGLKHGFFKGLSMNWIKGPIAVGISFTTYESTREFLRELAYSKRIKVG